MSEFIEIGTAALRDPVTGDFMPAVPLYIRAEDRGKCEAMVIGGDAFPKSLLEKFRTYKKEERRIKRGGKAEDRAG